MNSPSSSSVIYDEQSPFPPSPHSASMFEESHVPVIEESLMRVQICEKAEELKDTVHEKKSTLNEKQSDIKHQSLLQKNVNKRDPPNSLGHSDKRNLLKVETGIPQRGRSASPQKSASRYSEEHLEKIPSPLKNEPKTRPRDRSVSPRKGENSGQPGARAGSGQEHSRQGRGQSSSPKKQQKTEGSKDQSSAEAKLLELESRRGGGRARDRAERVWDGKEKAGVLRKDMKQSQSESGSPAKKTPITPGPWKVPSAHRATGTTGVAEKRL